MKKIILLISLIFSLSFINIYASSPYIIDECDLLTDSEISYLESVAETYVNEYDCGIYIRIKENLGNYYDIEEYSESLFIKEDLKNNSILFIIDMNERSYDIMTHGDFANDVFDDYAKDIIADDVVTYLSNGEYYDAFKMFLNDAYYQLKSYDYIDSDYPVPSNNNSYSKPHDNYENKEFYHLVIIGAPIIISSIVCLILYSKNKTKGRKFEAYDYVPKNGFNLAVSRDMFLYRNEVRHRIHHNDEPPRSHSGGGHRHSSGGGFSHHSGRF